MNKKYILILLAILFLLIICFSVFNGYSNNKQEVTVGDSIFTIPDGYHVGTINPNGDMNLTNDNNSLFIKEYNESIDECVNTYKDFKTKNNYSIDIEEFKFDNIDAYKSTISNDPTVHYWFTNNNKTYCIYTWDEGNMDSTVIELMKTVKNN